MPKKTDINKVLVIGSGPIIIGQAAEFDYSGTQACKSLKEEGIEVILINSNPATIMTDMEVADKVYIEPITLDFVKKILYDEKPDGILPSLGGQTGLNMAIELAKDGILDELNIQLLGTSLSSIKKAEDRDLFKKTMEEIDEKVPHSTIVTTLENAVSFAEEVGFPIIIRPAYTLGGSGGGIAHDMEEFKYIAGRGLKLSIIHQVLLEQSVAGWKEIEYEVMRDNADNCIVICNMENFDPVGVHTGDSIVVAPCQTLSDVESQMLRSASIKIIRALEINGGCNIQFALNPHSFEYVVIEVNPRVSRSSALASKATGYPIARVTAKIAIGFNLDEIKNSVTKNTYACFEPTLDYMVTKIPRWAFDKFGTGNRTLGTQMKATGEVMAIGRTFEESLLKAIDSLDIKLNYQLGLKEFNAMSVEQLREYLKVPKDDSIFAICKALQKGISVEEVVDITKVDYWFIKKLEKIVLLADELMSTDIENIEYELMSKAKKVGFGDSYIANLLGTTVDGVIEKRKAFNIHPVYKMVDTCAGEFEAVTPYYYSTYEEKGDTIETNNPSVLVIGSGPIRIGQGIEFDYCSVHSVQTLRELGIESIIVNNNPETVSTDFDTSDKLYFEPLTKECVLDIIDKEKPEGVIVQFGGQTAINLAKPLKDAGVKILGTSVEDIDVAEDRDKFLKLLNKLNIPLPPGSTAFSIVDAVDIAKKIGYPVLVRPSYVLGGRAMEIVYNDKELKEYMQLAVDVSTQHPVLIDKYITGKEVEVDGISDGKDVLIPGIMEHIERAGVHSGDSMSIYPPQSLNQATKDVIVTYTEKLAKALHVKGLFNIQFVIDEHNKVYVIEVNPRASRTIPILSKVTGIPMITLATKIIMGSSLQSLGYGVGLAKESEYVAVKAPVFSFSKLTTVDTFLGPEMKSTGEVMGVDKVYRKALYKALVASGVKMPDGGNVLFSIAKRDLTESLPIATKLLAMGYKLLATDNTCKYLHEQGVNVTLVAMSDMQKWLKEDKIDMVINTPTKGKISTRNGFRLRRTALEYNVTCITSLDTVNALLYAFEDNAINRDIITLSLDKYCKLQTPNILADKSSKPFKHLLSLHDCTPKQVENILSLAVKLKAEQKKGIPHPLLKGKTLGMIFSKSSTRTRVSFEVGMVQLGGHPLFLSANDIQLGRGETIYDTAKVLSRYIDGIMIRTFKQSDVEDLAKYGSIPIINGLTDLLHPCQALADLLTVYEYKGGLKGLKMAYVGDGNNVAHSLLYGCAKVGMDIAIATPAGYECDAQIIENAKNDAKLTGSNICITTDPIEAVRNADAIYTDTWVSMGQEAEKESRINIFKPYQVNRTLFANAKQDAIFLHCLPAYRGFEVTEDIIDGPQSAIFDEAENRLHAQKAVMAMLMGGV